MGKLFKFLKPRVGAVLAIVAVLIIQAYCDLSLPGYTSDIVNVGIQQGGMIRQFRNRLQKTTWKSYCCLCLRMIRKL